MREFRNLLDGRFRLVRPHELRERHRSGLAGILALRNDFELMNCSSFQLFRFEFRLTFSVHLSNRSSKNSSEVHQRIILADESDVQLCGE